VTRSLAALRARLAGAAGGDEQPLFEVAVELSAPAVALTPGLGAIQQAVNAAVKQARPPRSHSTLPVLSR